MTGAPPPGLLELSPVERGVVSIFGVASRFFVAMNGKGKLFGSVSTAGAAAPAGSLATSPGRPMPGSRRLWCESQDRLRPGPPEHKRPEAVR